MYRPCMASTISHRAKNLLSHAPLPPYLDAHFARRDDPDYIGLCVAENKLVWDLLRYRLTAPRPDIPHQAICYDEMVGSYRFREQLSEFMGRTFLGRIVPAEHIAVLAGTGSVLEILFHNIADPGDGILVPTPSYAGFWADLETRDRLKIVPVHTTITDDFTLTEGLLDTAYESAGRPIRALLYTNPDNPTGKVRGADEIEMVIDWTERRGIHLVLDEVYALSIHGDTPFVSGVSLLPSLGDRIHALWAFSKDFGASGLRCGVLITENVDLMRAVDALGYWALVSGDTQHMLGEMISDSPWVDAYIEAMRSGLRDSYAAVSAALSTAGVPSVAAGGGFFVLCDFRQFLSEPTWEAEEALWQRMLEEANVNLTPGAACHIVEPGFMRICFATEPRGVVVEAVERIERVLR